MTSPMHSDMNEALANLELPEEPLPAGAWDCHAHVFGPFEQFPLAEDAPYSPPSAPVEQYVEMLDRIGFAHGVVVHAGANGFDNSGMLNALDRSQGRLRGVAVIPTDTSDAELQRMHHLGVRAVRFTAVNQMAKAASGVLTLSELAAFAPRLRDLGWHAQIWAKADIVAENVAMFRGLGIDVVFDHMGQYDASKGVDDASFQAVLNLARDGRAWIKTTAFRNAPGFPEMDELRPFHEALIEAAPDRLLWGSDWPFIGMGNRLPHVARLLRTLRTWTGDDALVSRILLTNPTKLYG